MENSVATLGVQQHWILMHHLNFFYLLNFRNILLLKCLGQGDIFLKRAVIAMLILASWEMDSQISEKENLKKSRSLYGFAFFFSFYLFQIKEKYE